MLNFEDVVKRYPQRMRGFKENILKEYLQNKILDIIYGSKYADHLVFMGGTAIRIVHGGVRFSEDLDFDNRGLSDRDFRNTSDLIRAELSLDGYTVDVRNVLKGAYHCYIRFPGLLFEHGLSGHKQQRILIQIDAQPQGYVYSPEKFLLQQFGIFRYINTVPLPLLLAQKILACLNRKREKGRDFFDVVYLSEMTRPDYGYLEEKAGISTKSALIDALRSRVQGVNLKSLARDVEPFLFEPSQKDRIIHMSDWLERQSAGKGVY